MKNNNTVNRFIEQTITINSNAENIGLKNDTKTSRNKYKLNKAITGCK